MRIRKATKGDSEPIATCLLLAMEEIVYKFIGENDYRKAGAFMLNFVQKEDNQYSYQNCWVAEAENKVVGAVAVYDGAKLYTLRQPVLDHIKRQCNVAVTPEDETGPGEYYIDCLGVNPGHQGKGVGSKLLQYLIEEYVNKQGETLGLLVDEENKVAKRLYKRLGFASVGRKVLLGKKMEHLQVKS